MKAPSDRDTNPDATWGVALGFDHEGLKRRCEAFRQQVDRIRAFCIRRRWPINDAAAYRDVYRPGQLPHRSDEVEGAKLRNVDDVWQSVRRKRGFARLYLEVLDAAEAYRDTYRPATHPEAADRDKGEWLLHSDMVQVLLVQMLESSSTRGRDGEEQ